MVFAMFLQEGWTALMLAAQNAHQQAVECLLQRGADVEARDDVAWTALMVAAQDGSVEMIGRLLDGGADVNAANEVRNAVHDSASAGR